MFWMYVLGIGALGGSSLLLMMKFKNSGGMDRLPKKIQKRLESFRKKRNNKKNEQSSKNRSENE